MSKWDSYLSETVTAPVLGSSGRHYPSVQTALSCLDWIEGHWDARVATSVAASRDLLTKWLGHVQFVNLTIIEREEDS